MAKTKLIYKSPKTKVKKQERYTTIIYNANNPYLA